MGVVSTLPFRTTRPEVARNRTPSRADAASARARRATSCATMRSIRRATPIGLLVLAACAATAPPSSRSASPPPSPVIEDGPPALRLPDDVHPRAERLSLEIDPARETFRGVVEIDVHLD